ncbi:MAG: DNA replication and repair protein RecF [Bacteroidota bacterium]
MFIKEMTLVNYKNFTSKSFSFEEKINCFVGYNGVGKTNVLDAIYHLSYTKGYFNSVASQNIQYNTDFFVIEGTFQKNKREEIISCSLKRGYKKLVKRNGKEYEKLSDHFGLLPVVIISPSDTNLIIEGSDMRRKFMDSIISLYDKEYLQFLIKYNKVLAQRNSLLKFFAANLTFDQTNIDVYNEQLVNFGTLIFEKRKKFLSEFIPIFQKRYKQIIGSIDENRVEENVELKYRSQLKSSDLKNILEQNIDRDRILQYTSVGVHKDDLIFTLNNHQIKKNGSQGQQKSYLIALKLAQFDFVKQQSDITPILLLDDIFDKLDENRVSHLINLVNDKNFGQIFITDTHAERTESIIKNINLDYKMFQL